jgi:glycosyltransferase involved in cell wall biosynthesis
MNPRQKVAIIYPFFAHYRAPVLRELIANGAHDYYFLGDTADPAGSIKTIDFDGEARFIATRSRHLTANVMWQGGLLAAALRGSYDCYIFLGNATWPATWLAALGARLRGRRVLFWTHGWTRPERGLKRIFRASFYRLAHALLLYGHYARDIGLRMGFRPSQLQVIYNSLDFELQRRLIEAIDDPERCRLRRELFGSTDPVILASARLTRIKRFDVLVRALGIVNRTRRVNLLLIGDGPERDPLARLARQEGVHAIFEGACYDERRLATLFSIASAAVSPGNVGLTCMHSLAYGVPVITHDDPEDQMPEWEAITAGVTGALFAKGSIESLAAAIEEWTRMPLVPLHTRQRCIESIRTRYHPAVQRQLIDTAVQPTRPP